MTENRFIIVKAFCPVCAKAIKAVNFVNRYLPDDKRIDIWDNLDWEIHGYKSNPVQDKFTEEVFDGYPLIWIEGTDVQPAEPELLIISISKLLYQDMLIPLRMDNIIVGESKF